MGMEGAMDLRLGLYQLAHEHRLDARGLRQLQRLAGLDDPPPGLPRVLARGVAVLAAALAGLGVVFWVAANWNELGRFGRFALLQAFVVTMCMGAAARPAARAPLSLLALLGIGALFAFFGQTYQTGADPWQLFALWSALALPLAFAARSDVVWAPWALVAMTGAALWVQAHTGHQWRFEPQDARVHGVGWIVGIFVAAGLSEPLRRLTGAGPWARRTGVTLLVAMVTASALGTLFSDTLPPHYALALLVLAAVAGLHAWRPTFDLYGLSATAFGLVVLLVAGIAHLLFRDAGNDPIGPMFITGVAAAGLLASAVALILRLARARGAA
jgi:uncharacterized membrane protein